jgi:hypothetical protein
LWNTVEGVHVLKRIDLAGVCVALGLLFASCGGGNTASTSTTTTTNTGLQFTSPTSSPTIDASQTVSITANQSVMWSLQAAEGNPVGTLSNTTTAAATVTYTAPSSINSPTGSTQVTVVATSTGASTQSISLAVFINPVVGINPSTHLTTNLNCQYDPALVNNDGTVGATYKQGANASSASVAGGTPPYTWQINSGYSLPVGLSLGTANSTSQCPGNAASCAFLYGVPASAGCSQVQLQVTDGTGATATSPAYNLVITPAALKVQAPDYSDMYIGVAYPPTSFSVAGGTPPYAWTVNPNAPLPTNITLNLDATNSAVAYLTGTTNSPPPAPPALLVTDSQTPYPAVGNVTLNQVVNLPQPACAPFLSLGGTSAGTFNSSMSGSYAFLLHGFDANGAVVIAGSFSADGAGNVTGGVEDVTRTTSAGSQTDVSISGSYSVFQQQSDNSTFREVGCVTLTPSTGTTSTFAFTLGGCSTTVDPTSGECLANAQNVAGVFTTGRMIEFDSTGTQVAGIVRLQTTSAFSTGLSGSYSFGLSGWDPSTAPAGRYAAAGSVSASSATLSSAAADINDGGAFQSALTGGTGSYTVDSTSGRGTATLTVGSASFNLVLYVVSAQEVMLATTGTPSAANPIVSGEAIAAAGPFSATSLENSHMFHTSGLTSTGPDANIGILSFDGISNVSGTQYEDQAGTIGTSSLSGTYTVNSTTGRVVFSPSTTNNQSLGDHPLVGYVVPVPSTRARQDCTVLANCVTGFLISTDQSAQAGLLEFQTPTTAPPPPFSTLYVAGYYFYGTDEALDTATPLINGTSVANPTGSSYGGVQSVSYSSNSFYCQQEPGCTLLQPNEAISPSGTYSVNSNGTGAIGGETVSVTNGNVIFYIDESPLNLHPSVMVIEQ